MFRSKTKRHRRLAATLAAALLVGLTGCGSNGDEGDGSASSGDESLPTVTIAEVAQSTLNSAMYVASTLGYFTKAGVNVKIVNFGATGTTAVVSGQANLVSSGLSSMLSPVDSGKSAKAVYALQNGFSTAGVYVAADSDITSVAGLSGKSIVSLGAGTASYGAGKAWSQYVVDHGGKAVDVIPAASAGAKTDMLLSGHVAATVGQADQVMSLVKQNKIKFLVDPQSDLAQEVFGPISGPTASTSLGLWGMQDWIEGNKDIVAKVLAAIRQGDMWLKDHTPEEAAAELFKFELFKSSGLAEQDILEAWQQDKPFAAQTLGKIDPQAWDATVKLMESFALPFDVHDPKFGYDKVVDMSMLDSADTLAKTLFAQ